MISLGALAAVVLGLAAVIVPSIRLGATAAVKSSVPKNALRIVGLGDSVMTANSCPGCTSFLTSVGDDLAAPQQRPVSVWNYAKDGATSAYILKRLAATSVQDAVRSADVVVIQIGANDFSESDAERAACLPAKGSPCYAKTAATMRQNLTALVAEVKSLQTRHGARVVTMGYWNVFRDGEVGAANGETYAAGADQLTRWTNEITADVAKRAGVRFADAYTPFNDDNPGDPTDLLLQDGDHPNAAGQRLLADAVVTALKHRP